MYQPNLESEVPAFLPTIIAIIVSMHISGPLTAKDLIESEGRMEIDWSAMNVRFYGDARVPESGDDAFKRAEQSAWNEGVKYAEQAAAKVLGERSSGSPKASSGSSSAVRSTNTTYFAEGRVRVYLEKSLASVLAKDDIQFKTKQRPDIKVARNSGLILEVQGAKVPLAHYRIVSETGQVLFAAEDIAEDAYRQNLMGRWYIGSKPLKSNDSSPVKITAKLATNSQDIQVDEATWREAVAGNEALLQAAKIALIIP